MADPLAEKASQVSPYGYADNNPTNNINPDGMETYYGAEALEAFDNLKNQSIFSTTWSVGGPGPGDPKKSQLSNLGYSFVKGNNTGVDGFIGMVKHEFTIEGFLERSVDLFLGSI